MLCERTILSSVQFRCKGDLQNIAKGTTDPGVILVGLVQLSVLGRLLGLVGLVWFGRFELVGLVR